jgi:hypothetical protein
LCCLGQGFTTAAVEGRFGVVLSCVGLGQVIAHPHLEQIAQDHQGAAGGVGKVKKKSVRRFRL